jgi:hypothetical protein
LDYISSAWNSTVNTANAVGRGVSAVGQGISDGAHWAQHKVDQGVGWVDQQADHAVDTFEHSSIGNNAVGHYLGQQVHDSVHFTGGLVKGVSGLGTGVVGLAGTVVKTEGGAVQYATDGTYRRATNHAISQAAHNFANDPTALARNIGHSVKQAWDKDPADFLGQAVGVVGTTVLTAGAGSAAAAAGTAGRAAEGAELVGTAARAGEVAEAAGTAGEVAEAAGTAGEVTEAAGAAGEVTQGAAARAAGAGDEIPGALRSEADLPRDLIDMGHSKKHGVLTDEEVQAWRDGKLKPGKTLSWFADDQSAARAVQEAPDHLAGVRAANPAKEEAWQNFVKSDRERDTFGFRFEMDGVRSNGMSRAKDGTLTETAFEAKEVYIMYSLRAAEGGRMAPYVKTVYPVMPQ